MALAKKFNGEIISADSRQVYRGLDIGSGKITKSEMKGVSIIFSISPTRRKKDTRPRISRRTRNPRPIRYSFSQQASNRLRRHGILHRKFPPRHELPDVPPDEKLRCETEETSRRSFAFKTSAPRPSSRKNIDPKNKVRIIRAIEIAKTFGKCPKTKN